jgi:dTDP-4-dehydrorhamnose 3,5-epimerase
MALTDQTVISYLCSEGYNPGRERGVHPLDPDIGIDWPHDIEPLLSPRDDAAPGLAEARTAGLLPSYDECTAYYEALRG